MQTNTDSPCSGSAGGSGCGASAFMNFQISYSAMWLELQGQQEISLRVLLSGILILCVCRQFLVLMLQRIRGSERVWLSPDGLMRCKDLFKIYNSSSFIYTMLPMKTDPFSCAISDMVLCRSSRKDAQTLEAKLESYTLFSSSMTSLVRCLRRRRQRVCRPCLYASHYYYQEQQIPINIIKNQSIINFPIKMRGATFHPANTVEVLLYSHICIHKNESKMGKGQEGRNGRRIFGKEGELRRWRESELGHLGQAAKTIDQNDIQGNVHYTIQMFKRLIVWLVVVAVATSAAPLILINSSHTHNSFQLFLSVAPRSVIELYSKKIVRSSNHWAQIDTRQSPAVISPPFPQGLLLVNAQHQGRSVLEYYERTTSNDLNRHFHYIAVRNQGETIGYLLPSFSQRVPAFRADRIFRCGNTIASVEWIQNSAHVVVFSQEDHWRITESIDGGFRSDERGLYYGYAIDEGHTHPVKLFIGDRRYCLIDTRTAPAAISFDWTVRENYELNDILYLAELAGNILEVHEGTFRSEEL